MPDDHNSLLSTNNTLPAGNLEVQFNKYVKNSNVDCDSNTQNSSPKSINSELSDKNENIYDIQDSEQLIIKNLFNLQFSEIEKNDLANFADELVYNYKEKNMSINNDMDQKQRSEEKSVPRQVNCYKKNWSESKLRHRNKSDFPQKDIKKDFDKDAMIFKLNEKKNCLMACIY